MTGRVGDSFVYIVEDDAAVQQALSLLVQGRGFRVSTHVSTEDFLASVEPQAEQAQRACMLLDLNLDNSDGATLIENLRQRGSDLPVVVITAQSDGSLAQRATRAGALRIIEKPFRNGEVLQAIADALTIQLPS